MSTNPITGGGGGRSSGGGEGSRGGSGVNPISGGGTGRTFKSTQPKKASLMDRLKGVGGDIWSPIRKAFSVLDTPRAYAVATIKELNELDLPGPRIGKDTRTDKKFNLGDIRKNANAKVGFGDVLRFDNKWADRAIGLTGDLALDPLVYATFGASGAVKTGLKGIGALPEGKAAVQAIRRGEMSRPALRELVEKSTGEAAQPSRLSRLRGATPDRQGAIDVMTNRLARRGEGGIQFSGRTVVPGRVFDNNLNKLGSALAVHSPPAKAVRKLFVPRAEIARIHGSEAAEQVGQAFATARGTASTAIDPLVTDIRKLIKDTGATADDLNVALPRALETGASVRPEIEPLLARLKQSRQEVTEGLIRQGVDPTELHDAESYLHRVLTPAGRKGLREVERRGIPIPGEARTAMSEGGALKARQVIPEGTLDDAEAAARQVVEVNTKRTGSNPLSGVGGRTKDVYEHNAAKLVTAREAGFRQHEAFRGMLDELAQVTDDAGQPLLQVVEAARPVKVGASVAKEQKRVHSLERRLAEVQGKLKSPEVGVTRETVKGGIQRDPVGRLELTQRRLDLEFELNQAKTRIDELKATGKAADTPAPPEGWREITVGDVKVHAPPEIADELGKAAKVFTNDEGIRDVLRYYDKALNFWKGAVTVPIWNLAFFARNGMGNVFLNFLRGVSPVHYKEAIKYQKGAGDPAIEALMRNHGVMTNTAQEADLAVRGVTEGMDPRGLKTAARAVSPIEAGRKLNSIIENNARVAHFLHVYRETGDAARAAQSVRRYLFDYQDLTGFEREVMRRIIPFYTFMRKNVPNQLAGLAHTPGRISTQGRLATEAEEQGYELDLPAVAGVKSITQPFQPYGAANMFASGGLLGMAKSQAVGKPVPVKGTERFRLLNWDDPYNSEGRLDTFLNDLVPYYGRYGTLSKFTQRDDETSGQRALRLLAGIRQKGTTGAGRGTTEVDPRTPPAETPSKPKKTKTKAGGQGTNPLLG